MTPRPAWLAPVSLSLGMLLASGCAPYVTPPAPGGAQRPVPAKSAPAATRAAPIDSTPSPEALAVLSSIPEPLAPADRISPPSREEVAAGRDSGSGDVPVPSPVAPLGEPRPQQSPTSPAPQSPSAAPPPAAPPPGAGAGTAGTAGASTCWRVQVGAPGDSAEAEGVRAAASNLLVVPMVVEPEGGRYKVRNRDCLDEKGSDQLRQRAIASGFAQAFRVTVPPR